MRLVTEALVREGLIALGPVLRKAVGIIKIIRREIDLWRKVVHDAGIKAE